jgi:hypothetical protein
VGVIGQDRQLPALPRPRIDADAFEYDGKQARGHLLAGSKDRIIFARVVQDGCLAAPFDEPVGRARHGRDHDGHFMAGVDLALDVLRDVADAVDIGDRRSAEFHDETSHSSYSQPFK